MFVRPAQVEPSVRFVDPPAIYCTAYKDSYVEYALQLAVLFEGFIEGIEIITFDEVSREQGTLNYLTIVEFRIRFRLQDGFTYRLHQFSAMNEHRTLTLTQKEAGEAVPWRSNEKSNAPAIHLPWRLHMMLIDLVSSFLDNLSRQHSYYSQVRTRALQAVASVL